MIPASSLTADEFLVWEREQRDRFLYVRGEVFAMTGGSPRHNHLCARIIGRLEGPQGGCRVFSSDQKLGLPGDDFVYADAVVACGVLELRPGTSDVLQNPALIVEVLSKSTEAYDRGNKQQGYLATSSLRHLVLVSQREVRVEVYTRQDDGSFRFEVFGVGSRIDLTAIRVSLDVDDLYVGAFELPGD